MRRGRRNGFTLAELLIALGITSVVVAGVIGFFGGQRRVALQEEISSSVDDSLRIGLMRLSDRLRDAGYGVPSGDQAQWIPWVSGFTANPMVWDGDSGAPDAIDIALCRSGAGSVLTATASRDDQQLSLEDDTLVDTERRRLVSIGDVEPAHVVSIGLAVGIDTDPAASGAQGLTRRHFAGTPICRVDVVSYAVDPVNERLTIDDHSGDGPRVLLDNVSDLQVDTIVVGRQYRITLTARSRRKDPETNAVVTRSASTLVTVRN